MSTFNHHSSFESSFLAIAAGRIFDGLEAQSRIERGEARPGDKHLALIAEVVAGMVSECKRRATIETIGLVVAEGAVST